MQQRDHLLRSSIVCPDYSKIYPQVSHGKGVYLYDHDGKEYLDAAGGKAAVANIGHGRAELGDVIRRQVEKLSIFPTHYFRSRELDDYLEMLVDFASPGYTRGWTVSSGTEAVENALKAAIQYHQIRGEQQRYKILARWGSYHGNSVFTLDVGGMEIRRKSYAPLLRNFRHVSPAYCYRCPFSLDKDSCEVDCASELESCILEEGPETIAAFICEPVVGAALGAVPAPGKYFDRIRQICDKYGILLIADEVMTGFGRTGYNLGINYWNVLADIVVLGKGMASGYYPLSGLLLHENIANVFEEAGQPFLGGHTYSCNPLAAVIGAYVLNCIKEEGLVENSRTVGKYLLDGLQTLKEYPLVGDVRGMGLLAGIELVNDPVLKTPFPRHLKVARRLGEIAFEKGLILYPGEGSAGEGNGDHILITPPLVITEQDVDRMIRILHESLHVLMEECAA